MRILDSRERVGYSRSWMAPKSILVLRPRAEGCVVMAGDEVSRPTKTASAGIPKGRPIPQHRDTTISANRTLLYVCIRVRISVNHKRAGF